MPGLAPQNLRLPDPNAEAANDGADVVVELAGDGPDMPDVSQDGAILRIEHGDGAVTISSYGRPLSEAQKDSGPEQWFDNLVDKIDKDELSRIADELLRGIDADLESRKDWIEAHTTGLQLLGLKIEVPGLQGASDGAPVEGMSKVRHPLLLEAVLRFQANARSELLPTDGPVKVRNDADGTTNEDGLADALEEDLNHYLTAVATEYYPDTDRMLLKLGFGGTAFKKVYFCPLRMRPVSETVDSDDLIVNDAATDLQNAKRITHRVMMKPSTVKRFQLLRVYRDVPLSHPLPQKQDSYQREEKAQQGVAQDSTFPEDRDREIYECYCELEIKGFEHRYKGRESGLEIPYRVTIDVSSREILSITRNYDETKDLPEARKTFVKYTFVPGLGFYDIGLLHILGNTTNAVTAAWREMLDNGMYANFPGFLLSDTGARQNTNIFRIPPGGAALVKTGGQKMSDAVMPLPYNTQQMPALMALVTDMVQTGQRIGGTAELSVGEGKQDSPVGTTLALIEQATKVLNSVHKRMHAAQAEEFKLLVGCFKEHPESFIGRDCPSGNSWTEQAFVKALSDCNLVPQADPNTASHMQRVMKVQALMMLAQAQQALFDPIAVTKTAIRALGFSNPDEFLVPPSAMGQPPPELLEAQAKSKAEFDKAQAALMTAGAQVTEANAKAKGLAAGSQPPPQPPPDPLAAATAKAKLMDAQTHQQELGVKRQEITEDSHNQALDRQAEAHSDAIDLAKAVMGHQADAEAAARETPQIEREVEQ